MSEQPAIPARALVSSLRERGFDCFLGVPDSILGALMTALEEAGTVCLPVVREDDALGVACGAYLAGRKPVVLMQNSGLGTCLNVLTSLNLIYRIPCLMFVSWRGFGGKDAPEHLVMGRACTGILDAVGLPNRVLSASHPDQDLDWADEVLAKRQVPAVLLVRKGAIR